MIAEWMGRLATGFARGLADAAASPPAVLLAIAAVSLTLLSSLCNHRALRARGKEDYGAFIRYFAWFFALGFVAPLAYILLAARGGAASPAAFGLQAGNWRLGLGLSAAALPLAVVATYGGSRDPAMQAFYPLSRDVVWDLRRFVRYEIAYAALYYTAWEFLFRGILLFGVMRLLPSGPAAIAAALLLQATVSTVFHHGHPTTEVLAALPTSLVFGAAALATQSVLYGMFVHAFLGVLSDCFNRAAFLRTAGDRASTYRAGSRPNA